MCVSVYKWSKSVSIIRDINRHGLNAQISNQSAQIHTYTHAQIDTELLDVIDLRKTSCQTTLSAFAASWFLFLLFWFFFSFASLLFLVAPTSLLFFLLWLPPDTHTRIQTSPFFFFLSTPVQVPPHSHLHNNLHLFFCLDGIHSMVPAWLRQGSLLCISERDREREMETEQGGERAFMAVRGGRRWLKKNHTHPDAQTLP